MNYKTASGGYFLIPAGPAAGTNVAKSASADTYGSWVEMVASTAAALFIVGVVIENLQNANTYVQLDIGIGAAASEASVGEVKIGEHQSSGNVAPITLPYPIPVAAGARIACRTAGSTAGADTIAVSLFCINQADVVPIDNIDGYTPEKALRLILAALAGKLSGAATTTVTIRDAADAKARITATVDADGNRSAVTLDAT